VQYRDQNACLRVNSLQAENGKDIPEDSEDMAAAKEVLAAVEETFKA